MNEDRLCPNCNGSGEVTDATGGFANCADCDGIGFLTPLNPTDFTKSDHDPHDLVVLPENAGVGTYTSRKQEPGAWSEKEGS